MQLIGVNDAARGFCLASAFQDYLDPGCHSFSVFCLTYKGTFNGNPNQGTPRIKEEHNGISGAW